MKTPSKRLGYSAFLTVMLSGLSSVACADNGFFSGIDSEPMLLAQTETKENRDNRQDGREDGRDSRQGGRDENQNDREGDRDGRQDCRYEEGVVGADKRDCKRD